MSLTSMYYDSIFNGYHDGSNGFFNALQTILKHNNCRLSNLKIFQDSDDFFF